MKLNYTPQVGLRRRKPDQHRQRYAFWGGIVITVLFELVLMAKGWTPGAIAAPLHWFDGSAVASMDADTNGEGLGPPQPYKEN
jgi:hypothetical protein